MRVSSHATSLHVQVRFCGRYAEALGMDHVTVSVSSPATVSDVIAALRTQVPAAEPLLPGRPLVAIELEHVHGNRAVTEGDELVVLPPLAGG